MSVTESCIFWRVKMAEKSEVTGNFGEFDYEAALDAFGDQLVEEALPIVRQRVANEIHHITHDTERALETEKFAGWPMGKVSITVPYGVKLEFHHAPFMRPGARKARKDLRLLVKKIFGEAFKAQVRGLKKNVVQRKKK